MYQLNIGKAFPLVLLFLLLAFCSFFSFVSSFISISLISMGITFAQIWCVGRVECYIGVEQVQTIVETGQGAGDSRKGIQTPETKRRYEQIE